MPFPYLRLRKKLEPSYSAIRQKRAVNVDFCAQGSRDWLKRRSGLPKPRLQVFPREKSSPTWHPIDPREMPPRRTALFLKPGFAQLGKCDCLLRKRAVLRGGTGHGGTTRGAADSQPAGIPSAAGTAEYRRREARGRDTSSHVPPRQPERARTFRRSQRS